MRQQPPTRASNGSAVPYPCWDVCSITTKADTCSTVRSAATVPPHSPTPETSGRIFYSVGAGWLMSEEEFMKDITWLDMLKLKGSWGTLGNQNLDKAYPAEPLLTNAYSAVFGKPSAIYPGYQLSYLPIPVSAGKRWKPGKRVQKPTSSATACTSRVYITRKPLKTCWRKFRASPARCRASATSAP